MVTLTEKAIQIIKALSSNHNPPNNKWRISASGSYYSVDPGEVSYRDDVYECDGFTVVVDQLSMLYLEGAEIDYIDTPAGSGFTFSGPNIIPHTSESNKPKPRPDPRPHVQSMPCRIDRNQERQYATELSKISPGEIVAFPYDDVQYEAVIQRINSTNATVVITNITGSPRRNISVGEKVHVAASILARGMYNS